jgi:hypothetical protein
MLGPPRWLLPPDVAANLGLRPRRGSSSGELRCEKLSRSLRRRARSIGCSLPNHSCCAEWGLAPVAAIRTVRHRSGAERAFLPSLLVNDTRCWKVMAPERTLASFVIFRSVVAVVGGLHADGRTGVVQSNRQLTPRAPIPKSRLVLSRHRQTVT